MQFVSRGAHTHIYPHILIISVGFEEVALSKERGIEDSSALSLDGG